MSLFPMGTLGEGDGVDSDGDVPRLAELLSSNMPVEYFQSAKNGCVAKCKDLHPQGQKQTFITDVGIQQGIL